jgi:pectate lyase
LILQQHHSTDCNYNSPAMKLSTTLFMLAVSLVSAAPTPTLEQGAAKVLAKRASITDAANIGYATQNGG